MKRIRELDGLRCIAILGVLATHYGQTLSRWFDVLSIGMFGVDLFFGISGFLITTILLGLRGSPRPFRTFYARRSLRIFPPYYLVFAILVAAAFMSHEAIESYRMVETGLFVGALDPHLMSYVFHKLMSGNWLDRGTHPLEFHGLDTAFGQLAFRALKLGVFWSLSVEEIFYLLWAPIVILGSRRLLLTAAIAPLLICPVLRLFAHTGGAIEYTLFICRLDSLCFGACVALLLNAHQNGALRTRRLQHLFAGLLPISLAAFVLLLWKAGTFHGQDFRSSLLFSALGYSAVSLLFASVIGLCVLGAGGGMLFRILRFSPLIVIGTISYMMYLIHIPVYLAVWSVSKRVGIVVGAPGVGVGVASSAITTLLSWVSWRYFESPILRWKDRHVCTTPTSERVEAEMVQSSA